MVEEVTDDLDVRGVVIRVRWRGKGDDGPFARCDQWLTAEEVIGVMTMVAIEFKDSGARWEVGVGSQG